MARSGLPQQKLAEALGLKQQGLSRRLLGKTPFSIEEAFAIADILGVPVSEILPRASAA